MHELDMREALFYVFSTIPQTVGAVFAVLTAFVLYRFQADNSARPDDLNRLLDRVFGLSVTPGHQKEWENGIRLLSDDRDEEFLQLIERTGVPEKNDRTHVAYKRFARSVRDRPIVGRALLFAFVATSILILYSLVLLCFAPWIATRVNAVAYLLLAVGVIGVFSCLKLYWELISLLLRT